MTASYSVRLICLCFAVFFLVYLAAGLAVAATAPAGIRLAARMRPERAARFLFILRLFPLAAALFVVFGLCVPSYLWLEPIAMTERVGFACLLAALAGGITSIVAVAQTLSAGGASLDFLRRCRRPGNELASPGQSLPVWVIDGEAPLIALAGIFRPRILLSRAVWRAFSAEELDAALRHEQAHWTSRDNLKHLLLMFAPDPIPFLHGLGAVESAWANFAEWAADDRAVDGDSARSLSLASALVRIARMNSPARLKPPLASFVANDEGLSIRVNRLLCTPAPPARPSRWIGGVPGELLGLSLMFALIFQSATSPWLHALLERLVH